MKLLLEPGKYVVAVSGGVDSMVLLHMLVQQPELDLVVAHFEHGIRKDSKEDLLLVKTAAERLGIPFIYEQGKLGPRVSEAVARDARYAFLRRVKAVQGATAIVTAHHQDDVLETAILNAMRGTSSRGLSALRSRDDIVRPLLALPKQTLLDYAREHGVAWREDSTNQDLRYRRNYIRHMIVPRLTAGQRQELLQQIETASHLNQDIDKLVSGLLSQQDSPDSLHRGWFIQLPHKVAAEVMATWLRAHGAAFDRVAIERLVVFAKTGQAGKYADVDARYRLYTQTNVVSLTAR